MLRRYVASGILLAQSKNKEGENDSTSGFFADQRKIQAGFYVAGCLNGRHGSLVIRKAQLDWLVIWALFYTHRTAASKGYPMSFLRVFACGVLMTLLAAATAEATPRPWGMAVNGETRECGGFWGGDERGSYTLPDGWKAYYAGHDGKITTEFGSCKFERGKEKECCAEMCLKFVGERVGKHKIKCNGPRSTRPAACDKVDPRPATSSTKDEGKKDNKKAGDSAAKDDAKSSGGCGA